MVFNNHDPTVPLNVLSKVVSAEQNKCDIRRNNQPKGETSTILDSIEEENPGGVKNEHLGNSVQLPIGKFHKFIQVNEDRICAVKEVVCTPEGFSWTC